MRFDDGRFARAGTVFALVLAGVITASLQPPAAEARRVGEMSVRVTPVELEVELLDANPDYLFRELAVALYPDLFPNDGRTGRSFPEHARDRGGRLFSTDTRRAGAVADGESRLLVAVSTNVPGIVSLRLRSIPGIDVGELEVLRLPDTPPGAAPFETADSGLRAFALYRPPRAFHPAGTSMRLAGVKSTQGRDLPLEYRRVRIDIGWRGPGDASVQVERTAEIALLRPPVVLVHGTYDAGPVAWDWPEDDTYRAHAQAAGGGHSPYDTPSFARQLEARGFAAFVVNYWKSSGADVGQVQDEAWQAVRDAVVGGEVSVAAPLARIIRRRISSAPSPYSSYFADNARVIWDGGRLEPEHDGSRGEGIRHALAFFRETLNVAATRADVVGHSMGGVLARVYARGVPLSERRDRPGDNWYRRPNNWNRGDINRLITLGATHRGSHVPRLASQYWLHSSTLIGSIEWAWWHVRTGFKLGMGAFSDQDPGSEALAALGPLEDVPTHTIATVGTVRDLDLFDNAWNDPSYRGRFMITWPHTSESDLEAMFRDHALPHDGLEDAADLGRMMSGIREAGQKLDRIRNDIAAAERQEPRGPANLPARQWREQLSEWAEHLETTELPRLREQAFLRYVAAAFWNDWTDYTSSLDSALNGQSPEDPRERPFLTVLPTNYDEEALCAGVLHGYQPRHREIQRRLLELLSGGMDSFGRGLKEYAPPRYLDATRKRWTPSPVGECRAPVWRTESAP